MPSTQRTQARRAGEKRAREREREREASARAPSRLSFFQTKKGKRQRVDIGELAQLIIVYIHIYRAYSTGRERERESEREREERERERKILSGGLLQSRRKREKESRHTQTHSSGESAQWCADLTSKSAVLQGYTTGRLCAATTTTTMYQ